MSAARAASRPRPKRGVRQSLASIVLASEVLLVFLAALVTFGLKALPAPQALIGGAVLCLLLILTMGLIRYEWGFVLGWILQGVIVASGILLPLMFVIGAAFAGMWVYCMIVGGRIDRQKAAAAELGE